MKDNYLKKVIWFISTISIVLLITMVNSQQTSSATMSYSNIVLNHPLLVINKQLKEDMTSDEIYTISHQDIVHLTNEFIEQLVQEIDDDYKVIRYDSKEALLNQFERISSREVASEFVDFYYVEEENDLFIVPTELPPWFVTDQDYEVVQLANNKVKIIQDNTMDLYGDYMIEVVFTFCDNWKITDVHHQGREQGVQEEELPIF